MSCVKSEIIRNYTIAVCTVLTLVILAVLAGYAIYASNRSYKAQVSYLQEQNRILLEGIKK